MKGYTDTVTNEVRLSILQRKLEQHRAILVDVEYDAKIAQALEDERASNASKERIKRVMQVIDFITQEIDGLEE